MARFDEVGSMGATRINVGTSAIIKVIGVSSQIAGQIKRISGGSLEIVNAPLALTGTSAAGWGAGYLIEVSEAVAIGGPAVFYLAATGATVVVGYLTAFSGPNPPATV